MLPSRIHPFPEKGTSDPLFGWRRVRDPACRLRRAETIALIRIFGGCVKSVYRPADAWGSSTLDIGERRSTDGLVPWLIAAAYLAYFDRFVPAAGATFFKSELGLSDGGYGFVVGTLFALSYAVAAIAISHVGPRDGGQPRRRAWLLIGGLILWSAGSGMLAFISTARGFALAQLCVGVGQAAFIPLAVATIADGAADRRIGRATARFTIASTLGRSSAVLAAGAIITAIAGFGAVADLFSRLPLVAPWRATFLITTLPNLVVLAVLALLVMRRRSSGVADVLSAGGRPDPNILRAAAPAPHWRSIAGLFLSASAAIVVIQSIAIWYPSLIVRRYAVEPGIAAVQVGAVIMLTAPLGQWLGGRLIDRFDWLRHGPTRPVMLALFVAVGMLSIGLADPSHLVSLVVLGFATLVLGMGALSALAGVQRMTATASRPRANGLYFATITLVGLGTGPLLVGLISDASGDPATALANALVAVAAAMAGVAVLGHLLARVRTPNPFAVPQDIGPVGKGESAHVG